jgi:hypothetical protein
MKLDDYQYGFDGMTRDRMLEKMRKGWKSSETPCGRGSEAAMAEPVARLLPKLCVDLKVRTFADCGAGDLNWMRHVDLHGVDYFPYDLVPRHELVEEFDITAAVLPHPFDLVLCRHVLNHLSPALALQAMDNFVESGSKYLLLTNCDNQKAYWETCGMRLGEPMGTWKDATKWWLELHDLQSESLWEVRV